MRLFFFVLLFLIISLFANAQKYDDYNAGYIYDLQNVKSPGLIKWTPPVISPFKGVGDHLFFKLTEDDTRQKVESTKIQSFVMVADSFVVSRAKDMEKYPVLKVVFNKPANKLYARYRTTNFQGGAGFYMSNGYMIDYYFGPDPDHITEVSRKNFTEVMPYFVEDWPSMANNIKNKEYHYGDIDDMLAKYFKHKKAIEAKKAATTQ
jgi:hypothetical protein